VGSEQKMTIDGDAVDNFPTLKLDSPLADMK